MVWGCFQIELVFDSACMFLSSKGLDLSNAFKDVELNLTLLSLHLLAHALSLAHFALHLWLTGQESFMTAVLGDMFGAWVCAEPLFHTWKSPTPNTFDKQYYKQYFLCENPHSHEQLTGWPFRNDTSGQNMNETFIEKDASQINMFFYTSPSIMFYFGLKP